jgi:arginyl-tRNA synthetase
MTALLPVLAERVRQTLGSAFGAESAELDPVIRPSQFADFR